jgi:glutaminyl-peptide cyclotransferase
MINQATGFKFNEDSNGLIATIIVKYILYDENNFIVMILNWRDYQMRCLCYCLFLTLIFFFYPGLDQADTELYKKPSISLLKMTKAPIANIKVIRTFYHDPESFTEGLVYHKGYMYESTGLHGKSVLRKIAIKTGKVIKEVRLKTEYFGEGMAILGNRIYQLTWKNNTGIIYDLQTFKEIGKFSYSGEGWGLTTDGKILFMSDGSSEILCIDPVSMSVIRRMKISDGNIPINNLNELEFIRGEIWANVFMENVIVRISPRTGTVLGWVDLSSLQLLIPDFGKRCVLNGIAYNATDDRIFVTGKLWPILFEIKIQNK